MLFQYILGELGIEALAYAQNSLFARSFVLSVSCSHVPVVKRATDILFAKHIQCRPRRHYHMTVHSKLIIS